jgi:hypothetical protein
VSGEEDLDMPAPEEQTYLSESDSDFDGFGEELWEGFSRLGIRNDSI